MLKKKSYNENKPLHYLIKNPFPFAKLFFGPK